jgi:phosphatidylglycerophosphatase A
MMKSRIALAVATWFGAGYWPWGPGTAGSLAAVLLAWAGASWFGMQPWHFVVIAIWLTPAAIWCSTQTARLRASKDPQIVVVDEVLGQWIALAGAATLSGVHLWTAFVLFRIFDMTKPWPVRRLESLPEGRGIVADDLAAGVYAALVLLLARWFNLL